MNRPCPHRDDEPCSVCAENVALRSRIRKLEADVAVYRARVLALEAEAVELHASVARLVADRATPRLWR